MASAARRTDTEYYGPSGARRFLLPSSTEEYVIAVRSYARAHIFPHKTYRMLAHNGLTDRLYVFVANKAEKELYEEALRDLPYRAIVVGELGGSNAIRAICRYFPRGQRIVFMDDDLDRFFDFSRTGKFRSDSDDLARYLEDGFETIDRHECGAFTFSFMSNKMWLASKPFKEFRPFTLAGNFFGTRNDPAMITTEYSHGDDLVRSVRYLEKYGGMLVYWWAGFVTRYGKEEGGLQASGNRGTGGAAAARAETLRKTGEISWAEYRGDPLLQAYAMPPAQELHNPFVSMKMKTLPAVRKAMRERGTIRDGISWEGYFSKKGVIEHV
jgi:hypothetical protein